MGITLPGKHPQTPVAPLLSPGSCEPRVWLLKSTETQVNRKPVLSSAVDSASRTFPESQLSAGARSASLERDRAEFQSQAGHLPTPPPPFWKVGEIRSHLTELLEDPIHIKVISKHSGKSSLSFCKGVDYGVKIRPTAPSTDVGFAGLSQGLLVTMPSSAWGIAFSLCCRWGTFLVACLQRIQGAEISRERLSPAPQTPGTALEVQLSGKRASLTARTGRLWVPLGQGEGPFTFILLSPLSPYSNTWAGGLEGSFLESSFCKVN